MQEAVDRFTTTDTEKGAGLRRADGAGLKKREPRRARSCTKENLLHFDFARGRHNKGYARWVETEPLEQATLELCGGGADGATVICAGDLPELCVWSGRMD